MKNKKLYKVTCCGKTSYDHNMFDKIYVIAEDEKGASDKALAKMNELKYDNVDDYVSEVILVADDQETNKCLLII